MPVLLTKIATSIAPSNPGSFGPLPLPEKAATATSKRSRGTPRILNNLLRRIRDFAEIKGKGKITKEITQIGLKALNIDDNGLDEMDNKIIRTIIEKFNGGPVGIKTIATACSEEPETCLLYTSPSQRD